MTPLTVHAREAWEKYVSTGRIAFDLLRPPVCRSWERAHDLGARPDQFEAQTLGPDDTDRLLAREEELVAAARPFMTALSSAAGAERHAAMLGDRRAVVLDVVGDEQTVHGPERVPGPGALLSEEVTGSNGIGTPLAEQGYAQLVGPEHYIGGFHPFTCQGIPIHDAGEVIGVLSTSVRRVAASNRLHDILVCAAHGIGAEVLHRRLQRDVQRVLSAEPGDAQVLEQLRQDVVQAYAAARLNVQVAARLLAAEHVPPARPLLHMAQEAIDRFRQEASLWQELASSELGVPRRLDLAEVVAGLLELLKTEFATRRVELSVGDMEPVAVRADRRQLLRDVLRGMLRSFNAAGPGGAVRVEIRAIAREGRIIITPQPAAGAAQVEPSPVSLAYPLAGDLEEAPE